MIEKAIQTSLYVILTLTLLLSILLWEKFDREDSLKKKSFINSAIDTNVIVNNVEVEKIEKKAVHLVKNEQKIEKTEPKSFNLVYNPVASKEQKIVLGSWVEPKHEENGEFQGFTLFPDGTAKAINSELLDYKTWEIRGKTLSLWLDEDMETYEIEKVSSEALWLKIGESVFKYKRLTT